MLCMVAGGTGEAVAGNGIPSTSALLSRQNASMGIFQRLLCRLNGIVLLMDLAKIRKLGT